MQDTSLSFRAATRNCIIERIKRDGTCFINTLSTRRGLRLVGRSDASFVTLNSIQSRIDWRIARGGMVFNCPSEGDSGSEAGVTHWEYALRAWFAFVHASPPTGVTKISPYGTLPIQPSPSRGRSKIPSRCRGFWITFRFVPLFRMTKRKYPLQDTPHPSLPKAR